MATVRIAVHERYGDGLDALGAECLEDGWQLVQIEWRVLGAVGVDTACHRQAEVAGHKNWCIWFAMVPLIAPQAATDFDDIAKSLGCNEANGCTLAFEHGVGRNR